jgi:hypothetical protein
MHTGINCIRAQQSRRGTTNAAVIAGSLRENATRKSGAILKNLGYIEIRSNAKEYAKVQKGTILAVFVHLVLWVRFHHVRRPLGRECTEAAIHWWLDSSARRNWSNFC